MIQDHHIEEEAITDLAETRRFVEVQAGDSTVDIFPTQKSEQRLWEFCLGETALLTNEYSLKSFSFDSGVQK